MRFGVPGQSARETASNAETQKSMGQSSPEWPHTHLELEGQKHLQFGATVLWIALVLYSDTNSALLGGAADEGHISTQVTSWEPSAHLHL